ncbi:ABC transporter permease [Paenibacillus sinopodophylli]|uniref:ABC transporter permease n=1 Tax=Paenibacillus sinopodophylli TaxID=1837342 RepID=UPI00110CDE7E|nr:ABC transporter permease subunit [Paenibacillus sinopodophylli]
MITISSLQSRLKSRPLLHELIKNRTLFLMLVPGLVVLLLNNYLPMFGVVLAFKDFKMSSSSFINSLFTSEWVGWENFKFFMDSSYGFQITRNTILFNLLFIVLTLVTAVPAAIVLNELKNRRLAKMYQTAMFFPQFLSWVVVAFLAFAFFSVDAGFINRFIMNPLGFESIQWYTHPEYWIFILPLVSIWKSLGYNTIIYIAGISNIDVELYEAAVIDGAGKWKQTISITIPMLMPLMIILTLLSLGRIFNADFGLFYQVTQNSGTLYPVTLVIDTYVYNALKVTGDTSMSTAVGLYQAVVGLVLVLTANWVVKKINSDHVLF